MESNSFYNIKVEKAKAIRKYRQRRRIANFMRFMEIGVFLALVSTFSMQLPMAFKKSGEYFRFLWVTLISPRFVFVVGNVIVITLFAKSGQFSGSVSRKRNASSPPDLHEQSIDHSQKNPKTHRAEIENQRNNIVKYDVRSFEERRSPQRSQSDNSGGVQFQHEKWQRELKRSESGSAQKAARSSLYPEEKMSDEEFRRTVEAFITRQQRART